MLEIGKAKTLIVRTRLNGKLVPKLNGGVPETKTVQASVTRTTREALGGQFGPDRNRRLVVTLCAKDMIVFRPAGTRQAVQANLVDLYAYVLRSLANRSNLERAREAKARKAARLAKARQERAEQRLCRPL